jgi:hypothetical protein
MLGPELIIPQQAETVASWGAGPARPSRLTFPSGRPEQRAWPVAEPGGPEWSGPLP